MTAKAFLSDLQAALTAYREEILSLALLAASLWFLATVTGATIKF